MVATLVAAFVAGTGAGCLPSDPYAPVAALQDNGQIVVQPIGCPDARVKRIRIYPRRLDGDGLLDQTVPPVWQVSFASPTFVSVVAAGGAVPDGATLDVPFAGPLDPAADYIAEVMFENGAKPFVTFKPAELHDGRVMYADKYYGREEFEREVACKQ